MTPARYDSEQEFYCGPSGQTFPIVVFPCISAASGRGRAARTCARATAAVIL